MDVFWDTDVTEHVFFFLTGSLFLTETLWILMVDDLIMKNVVLLLMMNSQHQTDYDALYIFYPQKFSWFIEEVGMSWAHEPQGHRWNQPISHWQDLEAGGPHSSCSSDPRCRWEKSSQLRSNPDFSASGWRNLKHFWWFWCPNSEGIWRSIPSELGVLQTLPAGLQRWGVLFFQLRGKSEVLVEFWVETILDNLGNTTHIFSICG